MAKETLEQARAWLDQLEPSAVEARSGDNMAIEISKAISWKRIADMMEADRERRLETAPDPRVETDDAKRHREWKEVCDRQNELIERIAVRLEIMP